MKNGNTKSERRYWFKKNDYAIKLGKILVIGGISLILLVNLLSDGYIIPSFNNIFESIRLLGILFFNGIFFGSLIDIFKRKISIAGIIVNILGCFYVIVVISIIGVSLLDIYPAKCYILSLTGGNVENRDVCLVESIRKDDLSMKICDDKGKSQYYKNLCYLKLVKYKGDLTMCLDFLQPPFNTEESNIYGGYFVEDCFYALTHKKCSNNINEVADLSCLYHKIVEKQDCSFITRVIFGKEFNKIQDYCKKSMAVKDENLAICKEISTEIIRNFCYNDLANRVEYDNEKLALLSCSMLNNIYQR